MNEKNKSLMKVFTREVSCKIIQALYLNGSLRFSELKRLLGINSKILSENLFFLVDSSVLRRSLTMDVPSQTEYALTEIGRDAGEIIQSMFVWSEKALASLENPSP